MKKGFWILFVCTGNTCRSPLAEVIAKAEIRRRGLEGIRVSSAGTAASRGTKASPNARAVARRLGLSLARFRSRPLTAQRVSRADLILTMNRMQKDEITSKWPNGSAKAFVISEFSGSRRRQIEDPVGGAESAYVRCAQTLADEVRRILPRVGQRRRQRVKTS